VPEKRDALLQKIVAAKKALEIADHWRKKIGTQFFCSLHKEIKKDGAKPKDIGRIRDRQNWIGEEGCKMEEAYFYPPAASRVRPLLNNLESYLSRQDLDPLVQIAIGFAQFLVIHPFMDGNGRVARIFIPVLAYRKKLLSESALFLSEYFEANRIEYFQKLFRITKNEWENWIAFFLEGAILQADRTRKRFMRLKNLWHEITLLADEETARLLFMQPLLLQRDHRKVKKLVKEKFLIARGEEYLLFEPLHRAMREN
jgi:Fic family protein